MTRNDVLLCLSLTDQRLSEIHDRLTMRGHLVSPDVVTRALVALTAEGLAVTQKQGRRYSYRLAESQDVDAALDAAWAAK